MKSFHQIRAFDDLVQRVHACELCERMACSARIFGYSSGNPSADVMFVGEAPGRLGADETGIPFHGDQAGHNFEEFLQFANLGRDELFITNAVLCNPRDARGNNASPKRSEVKNCSTFLKQQIEMVNPKIVVTLGGVALSAVKEIEPHDLSLKPDVRTANKWYGRVLVPFYHPGQRALIHRSHANQRQDYQFLSEVYRRLGKTKKRSINTTPSPDAREIVDAILERFGRVSYFALHKIAYLAEYYYQKKKSERLTSAIFVRQKDGPYCPDLHYKKLRKIPGVVISELSGKFFVEKRIAKDLFAERLEDVAKSSQYADALNLLSNHLDPVKTLSDERLKTKVYLTRPMRQILKAERELGRNLNNSLINVTS